MTEQAKVNLCGAQKQAVKDILDSNDLKMSNLIRERVEILNRLGAKQKIEVREYQG